MDEISVSVSLADQIHAGLMDAAQWGLHPSLKKQIDTLLTLGCEPGQVGDIVRQLGAPGWLTRLSFLYAEQRQWDLHIDCPDDPNDGRL